MLMFHAGIHLDEEVCLARMRAYEGGQVCDHALVHRVSIHGDGDAVYPLFLDSAEKLYVADMEIHECACLVLLLAAGSDIHGASHIEHTLPVGPVLVEECYLARALEILDGDEAAGVALLGVFRLHIGHYAAHSYLALGHERSLVLQFLTVRVAHVVEYNLVVIQRVSGEVYTHQIALAVQSFYIAPPLCLGNVGCGYLHRVHGAEERVLRLLFLRLVVLSVAQ